MKFFFALLLFCSTSAFAEIYKWTDKDGNVHFGDNPQSEENATELNINTDARSGVTHSSGRDKDRDRLLKNRAEERAEKAEKKKKYEAKKKKMRRKCLLANYSSKQRAKSEKRLRKSISRYCSY